MPRFQTLLITKTIIFKKKDQSLFETNKTQKGKKTRSSIAEDEQYGYKLYKTKVKDFGEGDTEENRAKGTQKIEGIE